MVHPDTEVRYVNDIIGWGVFATRPIPRGTITWALDPLDQKITPEEAAVLPPFAKEMLDKFSYVDSRGYYILCWDNARFFNHSCEANCLSLGYDFEIAVRDIAAGEELTDDYGTLNPHEPFLCMCGSKECRGSVLPNDMLRLGDYWNGLACEAFFQIPTVAQPLWGMVSDRGEIELALADPTRLLTIHRHFHRRQVA